MNNIAIDIPGHMEPDGVIAVVGMAGRFPEAANLEEFWNNLVDARESIRPLDKSHVATSGIDPSLLKKSNYVDAFGWLENIDLFDPEFFSISPREAELRDPQHRLLIEICYHALENAGYSNERFTGDIALFAGTGSSGYLYKNLLVNKELVDTWGVHSLVLFNEKDFAATFVSYKLDLTGASININTGCSSSLVAIHMAVQNLLNYESDIVLSGGVSINSDQDIGYHYEEGGIHPPDGHIRPFDAKASGTIGGSGAGIIVLKRLQDALDDGDYIHAILISSAMNNDGAGKIGYTAPSVSGQSRVIRECLNLAQLDSGDISYVETHGTGTVLGDPIEIQALSEALGKSSDKKRNCKIGSLKSNIGHLGAASGVAGLIKVILSMREKKLPASLNYSKPNPEIDFVTASLSVNNSLTEWLGPLPLRAGVSSFGIGGTNAHIIVQEPPVRRSSKTQGLQLIVLSAKSKQALLKNRNKLVEHLTQNPTSSLADIAYTLQEGRNHYIWRTAAVARDIKEAIEKISESSVRKVESKQVGKTVLMFPGQGNQYLGMGIELYENSLVFKQAVDECCEIAIDSGIDLAPFFKNKIANDHKIQNTAFAQPLLFVVEYAYTKLLMGCGFSVDAFIGHSIGEYVAAFFAGVFDLKSALKLVCKRGRLMASAPAGAMLSVRLGVAQIKLYTVDFELDIAAVNSTEHTVVSGCARQIGALESRLKQEDVHCRRLATEYGFHSRLMEPILDEFLSELYHVEFCENALPFISNISGRWVKPEQVKNPEYWTMHLRDCVNFSTGISSLMEDGYRWFIEAGPGNSLTNFVNTQRQSVDHVVSVSLGRHPENRLTDTQQFYKSLGQLWCFGKKFNFSSLHSGVRYRVPLPNYQFDYKRYWIDSPKYDISSAGKEVISVDFNDVSSNKISEKNNILHEKEVEKNNLSTEEQLTGIWRLCFSVEDVDPNDDFYELGGDSLLASKLVSRIIDQFNCKLSIAEFMETPTINGVVERLASDKTLCLQGRVTGEI